MSTWENDTKLRHNAVINLKQFKKGDTFTFSVEDNRISTDGDKLNHLRVADDLHDLQETIIKLLLECRRNGTKNQYKKNTDN